MAITTFQTRIPTFAEDVDELFEQANALVDAPFGRLFAPVFPFAKLQKAGWLPPVEMTETPDQYVVTAEIPGLKKEDVKIEFVDGLLTLTGEKKAEQNVEKARYYAFERTYGSFQRAFAFPTPVETDKIEAVMTDGVLTIRVPKTVKAKAAGKLIDIK